VTYRPRADTPSATRRTVRYVTDPDVEAWYPS
jgi:hypothetical protein